MSGRPWPEPPPGHWPHALLPGYVLGDLNSTEAAQVGAHLRGCPTCQVEVDRLRGALYTLAADLPGVPVPAGSWERLQVRRAAQVQTPPPGVPLRPIPLRPRSPARRPAWALAAALGALLVLGGYGGWTLQQRRAEASGAQALMAQWTRDGARPLALTTRAGVPLGTLLVGPDDRCLLVLRRRPPAGQVYQVWGRQTGGPQAGVPVSLGLTDQQVVQVRYGPFDSVGVSLEPAGGSPAPTHPLGRVSLRRT